MPAPRHDPPSHGKRRPPLGLALGRSLVARTLFALTVGLLMVALILGWMVDRILQNQAQVYQSQRQQQANAAVTQAVERELEALRNLATLLAQDTELGNSVYYHLMLEGERFHVQASLERLPRGRRVEAQAVLDTSGRTLGQTGAGGLPSSATPSDAPRAAIAWSAAGAWVTARAPIRRGDTTLAWLVLGAHLQPLLSTLFPASSGMQVSLIESSPTASTGAAGHPTIGVSLQLATTDPARPAILGVGVEDLLLPVRDRVVDRLIWALPLAALAMGLAIGGTLLWQLRPLRQIGAAARLVGQGDLNPPLPHAPVTELDAVTAAFRQMLEDLRRYEAERNVVAQQERLQAIGRIAARVAHDINNPLTVIQTHLLLLQRRGAVGGVAEDTDLRTSLDKMQHHCQRCRRTVEQLLQYGRPLRLQCSPVDLSRLCADVAARARQQRPDWQIDLELQTPSAVVQADALLVEQVLDNLLTNAREACPDEPVSLTLLAAEGGMVLRVRDRGPGFSADALAHAFEPFYTSKRTGSGLGLASCQMIVHALGGRMRIESADPGACVSVWLPCSPDAGTASIASAGPALRPRLASPSDSPQAAQG